MEDIKREQTEYKAKRKGRLIPRLCSILGTLIILAVILICLPLSLPKFFGYTMFEVVSPSMEPSITVGSIIYTKAAQPEDIETGDIIVFTRKGESVTHRVIENRVVAGEFVTKGDANEVADPDPVPYSALLGKVTFHVPGLGSIMSVLSSALGKIYLLCFACCGIMLCIISGRIRALNDHAEEASQKPSKKKKKNREKRRLVLIIAACSVFIICGGGVSYVKSQYIKSRDMWAKAAVSYTSSASAQTASLPKEKTVTPDLPPKEVPPIEVDFEALLKTNPDVQGWIYCADSDINFPVLQGKTNDDYIRSGLDKKYSIGGSIFADSANSRGFADSNTIVYGHHMQDGSMFASLDKWQDQDYFDKHSVFWLLTPQGNYKVLLFSAYNTSAYSDVYTAVKDSGSVLDSYVSEAVKSSAVISTVKTDPQAKYVVFSTCAYVFDNARSVLHGMLVPLD